MRHWTLTEPALQQLLRESAITPAAGSPFGPAKAPRQILDVEAFEDRPRLLQALTAVARPEAVFGVATGSPADGPDVSWFYAQHDAPYLAFHREGARADHDIAWPFDHFQLLDLLMAPLASTRIAESAGVSLAIDAPGFVALAALVDAVQEASTLALLERRPAPELAFEPEELFAAARRGAESTDLRWMVPRAMLVAPIPLTFDLQTITAGLDSLQRGNLIDTRGGRTVPGDSVGLCTLLLGACSGVSALSTRRRTPPDRGAGWDLDHRAACRGFDGRLWAFEFGGINGNGFTLTIRDTDSRTVHDGYAERLIRPARSSLPAVCRSCGASLRQNSRFCAQCGASLR